MKIAPPSTSKSIVMKWSKYDDYEKWFYFSDFFLNKIVDKHTVAIHTICSREHYTRYMYSALSKLSISGTTLKVFAMRLALSLQLQDIHCIRKPWCSQLQDISKLHLIKILAQNDHNVHSLWFTQVFKCWDIHITLIAEANILTKAT